MNSYFGYTRVSTAKQGEQGVSLQEQRSAIEAYAARGGLTISRWFEERETAAKRGRPVFDRMMILLGQQKATGVVIHKIDRSARNLRDWADLGEMMDSGIEVHFANEALDLNSRGGRLSADIQAVVAADYIRNLRDETIKGMRGRYKQGLFPLPAPIGYLDRGSGQPKVIDPTRGPLVKKMFELYASARYGHHELADQMYDLGLRTKSGQRVKKSTLAWVLNNPFYYGLVRLKATGQLFEGKHDPLISRSLFRAAREVASQRLNKRAIKHDFSYRRSLRCGTCGYNLTGERVKGIVYYRCHTTTCGTNTIRDDVVTAALLAKFSPLEIADEERRHFSVVLDDMTGEAQTQRAEMIRSLQATLGNTQERLARLADAYLDGVIDRDVLQEKQKALVEERKQIEGRLNDVQRRQNLMIEKLQEFLDFSASIRSVFKVSAPPSRQRLLRRVALRLTVSGKSVAVLLDKPYQLFASRPAFRSTPSHGVGSPGSSPSNSGPDRDADGTIEQKSNDGHFLAVSEEYGCPPQEVLRGEMKQLLLEIDRELLTDEPLERIQYSRTNISSRDL